MKNVKYFTPAVLLHKLLKCTVNLGKRLGHCVRSFKQGRKLKQSYIPFEYKTFIVAYQIKLFSSLNLTQKNFSPAPVLYWYTTLQIIFHSLFQISIICSLYFQTFNPMLCLVLPYHPAQIWTRDKYQQTYTNTQYT